MKVLNAFFLCLLLTGCASVKTPISSGHHFEGLIIFKNMNENDTVLVDGIPVEIKNSVSAIPVKAGPHRIEIISGEKVQSFFVEIHPGFFVTITPTSKEQRE